MDLCCEYHKEHGHILARCRELKKVIDCFADKQKWETNFFQLYNPYGIKR